MEGRKRGVRVEEGERGGPPAMTQGEETTHPDTGPTEAPQPTEPQPYEKRFSSSKVYEFDW